MRVLLLSIALLMAGCATNGNGGAGTTTTTLPASGTDATTTLVTTTAATTTMATTTTATTTPTTTPTVTTATNPTPTSTTPSSGTQKVDIHNFRFIPASITVPVGTTVTWVNADGATHTATADDDTFDSGSLSNGASFPFTFTTAGTFEYRCDLHTSMRGTVVVS